MSDEDAKDHVPHTDEIDDCLAGIEEKRRKEVDGRFSPLGIADHFFAGDPSSGDTPSTLGEAPKGWTLIFTDGDYIMPREPKCIFSPLTPGKFENFFKKRTDYGINIFRPPFPPEFEGAFSAIIIDGKLEGELARLVTKQSIERLLCKDSFVYLLGKEYIITPLFVKGFEIAYSRNILKLSPLWGNDVTRRVAENGTVVWVINDATDKVVSLFDPNMKPKMESYRAYKIPDPEKTSKREPIADCGVHNLFTGIPCRLPEECVVRLISSRQTRPGETVAIRGPAPPVISKRGVSQSDAQSSAEPTEKLPKTIPEQTRTISLKIVEIPDTIPSSPVTFSSFTHISKTDSFLANFTKQLLLLYRKKLEIYNKTIKSLRQELLETRANIYAMHIAESNTQAIKEAFPGFISLQSSIKSIENIISRLLEAQKALVLSSQTSETPTAKRFAFEKIVSHPTKGIASIVGRETVKDHIARMLYAFSKDYRSILKAFGSLALLGNAGIGKTSLMKVIGYALSKSGILVRKSFRIVTRRDMISQFHGGTAHQTRDILISSLEGVIGIDECHSLIAGGGGRDGGGDGGSHSSNGDYGEESVSELVNFMDKYIGLSFVIVAGYTQPMMSKFFARNEGLSRRFQNRFILEDYTPKDLTLILIKQLHDLGGWCTDDVANVLFTLISEVSGSRAFKNQAGDMLNLATKIHTAMLCQVDHSQPQEENVSQRMEDTGCEYSIPIVVNAFRDFVR